MFWYEPPTGSYSCELPHTCGGIIQLKLEKKWYGSDVKGCFGFNNPHEKIITGTIRFCKAKSMNVKGRTRDISERKMLWLTVNNRYYVFVPAYHEDYLATKIKQSSDRFKIMPNWNSACVNLHAHKGLFHVIQTGGDDNQNKSLVIDSSTVTRYSQVPYVYIGKPYKYKCVLVNQTSHIYLDGIYYFNQPDCGPLIRYNKTHALCSNIMITGPYVRARCPDDYFYIESLEKDETFCVDILQKSGNMFSRLEDAIINNLEYYVDKIIEAIGKILREILEKFLNIIGTLFEKLFGEFENMIETIVTFLISVFEKLNQRFLLVEYIGLWLLLVYFTKLNLWSAIIVASTALYLGLRRDNLES